MVVSKCLGCKSQDPNWTYTAVLSRPDLVETLHRPPEPLGDCVRGQISLRRVFEMSVANQLCS